MLDTSRARELAWVETSERCLWVMVASLVAREDSLYQQRPGQASVGSELALFVGPGVAASSLPHPVRVVVRLGHISVDQGELVLESALAGLGVAQVFDFMAREHVNECRLVEVLSECAAPGPPMHALITRERRRSVRVRAFLDFALDIFRESEHLGG